MTFVITEMSSYSGSVESVEEESKERYEKAARLCTAGADLFSNCTLR
jgi:hypothetical protein